MSEEFVDRRVKEGSVNDRYVTIKLPNRAYPILTELKHLMSARRGEPVYNTRMITRLLEEELERERALAELESNKE
jgi:hypothetical protein